MEWSDHVCITLMSKLENTSYLNWTQSESHQSPTNIGTAAVQQWPGRVQHKYYHIAVSRNLDTVFVAPLKQTLQLLSNQQPKYSNSQHFLFLSLCTYLRPSLYICVGVRGRVTFRGTRCEYFIKHSLKICTRRRYEKRRMGQAGLYISSISWRSAGGMLSTGHHAPVSA